MGAITAEKLEGWITDPVFSSSVHSPSTLIAPPICSFNRSLSCLFSPAKFGGAREALHIAQQK